MKARIRRGLIEREDIQRWNLFKDICIHIRRTYLRKTSSKDLVKEIYMYCNSIIHTGIIFVHVYNYAQHTTYQLHGNYFCTLCYMAVVNM